MQTLFRSLAAWLAALAFCAPAFAAGQGTADEATALVKKAVAYYKAHGRDKALAEFNNAKGQFVDRDLYIFVIDTKGQMLAHGANPRIVNKQVLEMRDVDGEFLFKKMIATAQSKGTGWVNYKWPNPISDGYQAKSTYIEKADDIIVGCGIYK